MRLEIRLHGPRFAAWVLFAVAGICWLVGIDYRLEHGDEGHDKEPKD